MTTIKPKLHSTQNDLPASARAKLAPSLNVHLANAIDLQLQAKQAHWNVKGPHFMPLHELFDKVAEAAESFVDDLAERCVQLGGSALGSAAVVAKKTELPAYPDSIVDGRDHVRAMVNTLGTFAQAVRAAIDEATELGDADTADLFTEISRKTDKLLWFVEAHLQADH